MMDGAVLLSHFAGLKDILAPLSKKHFFKNYIQITAPFSTTEYLMKL
jgi:hypothetical protein